MKFLILGLFLIQGLLGNGQQYNFISYGVKEGLAQSQVTDICQDNLGNLWIGTKSGLSKFDSHSFINYSINDGLADNQISHVLLSKSNEIWIVTPKGLSLHSNNGKFNSFYFEDTKRVNDIIEFRDTIYIATNDEILKFDGKSYSHVLYSNLNQKIRALDHFNDSLIFCATNTGLFSVLKDSLIHVEINKEIRLNLSDLKVRRHNIIMSSYNSGIIDYNLKNKKSKVYSVQDSPIRSLFVDDQGIWAASVFGMIEIIDDHEMFYTEQNGLTINSLKKIIKDNEGNIWIATYGKGLLKFSGKSVMTYGISEGLSSDIIMSISQLNNKEYVFGTYDKGLNIFSDQNVSHYNNQNGMNRNSIWSVCVDLQNITWVGTSNGVNCIKNNTVVSHPIVDSIEGKIRSIEVVDDKLYFGGNSGLWCYSNMKLEHVLKNDKYDINKIDFTRNKLFIGTRNGLFWHDINNILNDFNHLELPQENINTINTDVYDNLWVGTTNGLYIISPSLEIKGFELDKFNYKAKDIVGILTDSKKRIWVSTNNGVYLLSDENPFESSPKVFHFTLSEGLVDMECNLNAIFEDDNKHIWIGTSTGLARINPELNKSLFSYSSPQLSITGIRLFKDKFIYKEFETVGELNSGVPASIKFPFKKNHVTFDFIGINNKNPENVQYSYRLVGAEKDWSSITKERSATYSFISPGTYKFQVRAINKNLEWTKPVEVEIVISPPYWQTWWFILIFILIVMLIVYYLLKLRLNGERRKKDNERLVYENKLRNLEQQSLNASMNRHFIFNSLNSIQYFINSSDKKSANKFLSNFAQLIRKNLDSSTQPNFLVSLGEEIERINLYLTLEKMRFNEKFDYQVIIDDDIDQEMIHVPSMILQPFVENSIIHGVLPKEGKGNILVHIKEENDSVVFEVEDDGVGIDDSLSNKDDFSGDHKSQGMEITANRVELLRKINGDKLMIVGPFQVNDNGESTGTKVIIKLPIY